MFGIFKKNKIQNTAMTVPLRDLPDNYTVCKSITGQYYGACVFGKKLELGPKYKTIAEAEQWCFNHYAERSANIKRRIHDKLR
jgi:hypothetical protein